MSQLEYYVRTAHALIWHAAFLFTISRLSDKMVPPPIYKKNGPFYRKRNKNNLNIKRGSIKQ